jgi:hypothetical protein
MNFSLRSGKKDDEIFTFNFSIFEYRLTLSEPLQVALITSANKICIKN